MNGKERTDELGIGSMRLIQDTTAFCFGVDAVLLADFAAPKKGDIVCDMGCASGIIPVLLAAKSEAAHITGIEIQRAQAELFERNIALNSLEGRVSSVCGDLKDAPDMLGRASFDLVTCNPPYKENGGGLESVRESLRIARHEVMCTLEDVITAAAQLVRPGGRFAMIHRPERVCDIMCLMRQKGLEPKRMRFVHPKTDAGPVMVLVEGRRGSRPKLTVEKPLVIYDGKGGYTAEIMRIYERDGE